MDDRELPKEPEPMPPVGYQPADSSPFTDLPELPPAEQPKEFVVEGATTTMPRTPEMKQAQTASNRAEKASTAKTFRTQRAGAEKQAREERLGKVDPPDPDLPGGTNRGAKSPGSDSIRGAQDVNSAQVIYQEQLASTLTTMAKILMEATVKLEQIENYFDRLR
jgi:hypothetical protein